MNHRSDHIKEKPKFSEIAAICFIDLSYNIYRIISRLNLKFIKSLIFNDSPTDPGVLLKIRLFICHNFVISYLSFCRHFMIRRGIPEQMSRHLRRQPQLSPPDAVFYCAHPRLQKFRVCRLHSPPRQSDILSHHTLPHLL